MLSEEIFYGVLSKVTSTTIEIKAGAVVARYTGNFDYDEYGVYGQLRGYTQLEDGQTQLSVTGINVDAYKFMLAVDDENIDAAYGMILRGSDTFNGSSHGDRLLGFDRADMMYGNGGSDKLYGGRGSDKLYAGSGWDKLIGGTGKDQLYGGTDSSGDDFVFTTKSDSGVGKDHRDVIHNFTRSMDDIDLRGIDARASTSPNDAFTYSGQKAAANSVWWTDLEGSAVSVRADTNGDATADVEILVKGASSLTADNFFL